MNIFVVDKDYPQDYHLEWERELINRGHTVSTSRNIISPLSQYDLAIAHPEINEIPLLMEELKRRRNFQMIIHSGEPNSGDILELRQNEEQVYYFYSITPQSLAEAVENLLTAPTNIHN